jgi:hypothetical protein
VPGKLPMPASTTGANTLNARGSKSSPTHRSAWPPRLWPAFSKPRKSSLRLIHESHSSARRVGRFPQQGETADVSGSVEGGLVPLQRPAGGLPHFAGDWMFGGVCARMLVACACVIHKAIASAARPAVQRLIVSATSFNTSWQAPLVLPWLYLG